ncbi:class I SAM-dependent methyltransferase [Mycolicibacterium confluentis]|uniref:Uncharacterized protein n=1 Tax=Mycolicibacterium confluentis TaxID=28047 RepID=A0A7I7Y1I3_9MYCO|nr:methyltransferase domain-containing protein [Mycolicibacterium confluentis]MCV7320390.1 hypothetical protein [Mycolicibacterium confluentis]ORV21886.1 hypothetical protein AWB99_05970 [Mycolicibacterium confluentis]BBZ35429.1 hypothetical protein MCNF_40340 [Mycolicibacterium confluentis]
MIDLGSVALALCIECTLAQLDADSADAALPCLDYPEPSGDEVTQMLRTADAAELLVGDTVRQFGGRHGGSWLPLLTQMGFTPVFGGQADIVVDNFGAVHDPDQRSAFRTLAEATAPGGVLLLQFDSVADLVRCGRWDSLSPNHFAYYSLNTLIRMLSDVGMSVVSVWRIDPVRGTTMAAAVHARYWPADAGVERMLADEHQLKITSTEGFTAGSVWAEANRVR